MTRRHSIVTTTIQDLSQWLTSDDTTRVVVARVVRTIVEPTAQVENRCHELASTVRDALVREGVRSRLLEGEVPLEANEWRSHYVVLVENPSGTLMVIDLSAAQFPTLSDVELIVIEAADVTELKKRLVLVYGGWA